MLTFGTMDDRDYWFGDLGRLLRRGTA